MRKLDFFRISPNSLWGKTAFCEKKSEKYFFSKKKVLDFNFITISVPGVK